jgi:hypothetical protein
VPTRQHGARSALIIRYLRHLSTSSPFDRLRVSGSEKALKIPGGEPLMLSLSKDGVGFVSNLLGHPAEVEKMPKDSSSRDEAGEKLANL